MQSARAARARGARPARTRRAGPRQCVAEARAAGFEHVNLDLIYGTPGESRRRLAGLAGGRASAPGPTTSRAYALIVEEGTRLAAPDPPRRAADARRRRARRPLPDRRRDAGRGRASTGTRCPTGPRAEAARCRHNLLYWTGGDWWGVGPGAHSHVGGVRWWNVKHPAAYAAAPGRGRLARRTRREVLDRRGPRASSGSCWSCGSPPAARSPWSRRAPDGASPRPWRDGLLELEPFKAGRVVLTLRGRLLADAVVRDLLGLA